MSSSEPATAHFTSKQLADFLEQLEREAGEDAARMRSEVFAPSTRAAQRALPRALSPNERPNHWVEPATSLAHVPLTSVGVPRWRARWVRRGESATTFRMRACSTSPRKTRTMNALVSLGVRVHGTSCGSSRVLSSSSRRERSRGRCARRRHTCRTSKRRMHARNPRPSIPAKPNDPSRKRSSRDRLWSTYVRPRCRRTRESADRRLAPPHAPSRRSVTQSTGCSQVVRTLPSRRTRRG